MTSTEISIFHHPLFIPFAAIPAHSENLNLQLFRRATRTHGDDMEFPPSKTILVPVVAQKLESRTVAEKVGAGSEDSMAAADSGRV